MKIIPTIFNRVFIISLLLLINVVMTSGCACILASKPSLKDYTFKVYRPSKVIIYKAIAGIKPEEDKVFIYLAVENESATEQPLCMAHFDSKTQKWQSAPFYNLKPLVVINNQGAPIIGEPEVLTTGIANRSLSPGERFPEVGPDIRDFPINESNFRRDFVIVIKPNRMLKKASGYLQVEFFFEKLSPWSNDPLDERSQVASFRIPIELLDEYRPEVMLPEPSQEVIQ